MVRRPVPAAQMTAAAIDRFGPPSVLTPHRVPVPRPTPGQVLIALDFAGVGVWVPIAATCALRSADKSHRRLERGHVLGRLVLRVHPS